MFVSVAEGEVLIRVKACGLSFQDLMLRQGAIDSPPKCPVTLGFECANTFKIAPEGVDVVLDCIYGEECNRGYSLLKPLGKYILYGSSNVVTGETKSIFSVAKSWWQVDKVSPIKLFDENKTLGGFNLRHFLHHQNGSATIHSVYDKVIALWKKGSIKPVIDSTWALEDLKPLKRMADTKRYLFCILPFTIRRKLKPLKQQQQQLLLCNPFFLFQGLAVAQLCKTVADVKLFGIASKSKHEALSASIEHLLERGTDYASEVRKIAPEGVDVVLDCIYGEECNRGYSLLKPLGKYILYGSSNVVTGETKSIFSVAKSWWQVDKVSPIKLFDENKTLGGFNLRHFLHHQNGSATIHSVYDKVIALWKKGSIKPVIDSTWALEDVHEGMQKMHERKNVGKIVLDPSLEPKPKPATPAKEKGKKGDKEKDKEDKEKKNKEEEANGTSASPGIYKTFLKRFDRGNCNL
ncbi:synaptic vesicle membrane protein VAT-1 homolog-like [Diaphorina citri]|uniref:Synaptic vesicle membrane protein VAT-1 homolog-like n=1 Tax=Diaphorina citri TaxID=121845 RepID=A0A3Q0INF6_DIACI|nr:synaptic vesicle membrane protein VAT-1 homolog-like [Diaphorina citri]